MEREWATSQLKRFNQLRFTGSEVLISWMSSWVSSQNESESEVRVPTLRVFAERSEPLYADDSRSDSEDIFSEPNLYVDDSLSDREDIFSEQDLYVDCYLKFSWTVC